ncbi:putative holin-like toxin [Salisediminibacterium halotolerans]|nr:putative holin-like toxin [Salisediminibacterium haloalkalitolerans]
MVTYDTLNILIQFGIFLTTGLAAISAILAIVTDSKKK